MLLCFPPLADAQQAAAYFEQNCAACHTIGGGRLVGPDLKDVTHECGTVMIKALFHDRVPYSDSLGRRVDLLLQQREHAASQCKH